MFVPMFLGAAAVCAVLAALAVKIKKCRGLMAVLTAVALVPTVVLGLIACGAGDLVHYPGDPAAAVEGMVEAMCAADDTADAYVLGSLGLETDTAEETTVQLMDMLGMHWAVSCGAPVYEGFTARLPVELTRVDMEAWPAALDRETNAVLNDMAQTMPRPELRTEDGEHYREGVTEQAYETALGRMLTRGGEYLRTDAVTVTLSWTPFGWQILLDEALVSALEGYDTGDPAALLWDGSMTEALGARMNTARGEILEALPIYRRHYTIPIEDLAAPVPDPAGFGSTDDPKEIEALIDRAAHLTQGRTMSWTADTVIKPGSKINYYYDETILVIQWKESRDGCCVTYGEVIVQDGSQIRRVLADNTYRSFAWETPTQMSQRTNAVLGMTGDFYMFRAVGIMVYQGEVYRTDPSSMHHLFITRSGDLIMTGREEIPSAKAEQFAEENDVSFSLAFGPKLIENGEKLSMPRYIVGEFFDDYPRAAIGEVDPLHFVVMTAGKEGTDDRVITLPEAQDFIYEKGVHMAYSLDGGRTANMTVNGELTNDPAYREERTMSDMFYFATALPESER